MSRMKDPGITQFSAGTTGGPWTRKKDKSEEDHSYKG